MQRDEILRMLNANGKKSTIVDMSKLPKLADEALWPNQKNHLADDSLVSDFSSNMQTGFSQDNTAWLARQPEIQEVVDEMIASLIKTAPDSAYFCRPTIDDAIEINEQQRTAWQKELDDAFNQAYSMLGFTKRQIDDKTDIYKILKLFMHYGKAAWFIEYDNPANPTKINNIWFLNPRKYKFSKHRVQKAGQSYAYWRIEKLSTSNLPQNYLLDDIFNYDPINTSLPSVVLDGQLIYIDWRMLDIDSNVSYTAMLERNFNLYRVIERSRIAWAFMNSQFRTQYTIPVKGKGRISSRQVIKEAMGKYYQQVRFDDETGEVSVNDSETAALSKWEAQQAKSKGLMPSKKYLFNREIWLGETSSGIPRIEPLNNQGPDLNDVSTVEYFWNKFVKRSWIPRTRFQEDQPQYWSPDPTQVSHAEERFDNRLQRVRDLFAQSILKPTLRILQLNGSTILDKVETENAIRLQWKVQNPFRRQVEMAQLRDTVNAIEELYNSLIMENEDGQVKRFFSKQWLVQKYLQLNASELEINRGLVEKEAEENKGFSSGGGGGRRF